MRQITTLNFFVSSARELSLSLTWTEWLVVWQQKPRKKKQVSAQEEAGKHTYAMCVVIEVMRQSVESYSKQFKPGSLCIQPVCQSTNVCLCTWDLGIGISFVTCDPRVGKPLYPAISQCLVKTNRALMRGHISYVSNCKVTKTPEWCLF